MTSNSVPFDPGYAKHITSFMYFNEQVKIALRTMKTPQQRSFKYKQFLPQIIDVLKREIGFYYGCLLWASYISCENPSKEITDNSFYGKSKEELEQYDYLQEVNYLLDFFTQYPKDLAYYRVNGTQIEEKYIKTVEIYKEFLIENESFINVKNTSDLKIPTKIKTLSTKELPMLKALIDLTVNDGNFERLFEFEIF